MAEGITVEEALCTFDPNADCRCNGHSVALPHRRKGHHYILVVCDYATWYPEALPLCSIDVEHVAKQMSNLFL